MSHKQIKICHLTVLNPAEHSRIFFKEATSQLGAGFSVTVIGQGKQPSPYDKDGIRVVPIRPFGRLSLNRMLLSRWRLLWLGIKEKADVYVLHAPELLGLTIWLKVLTGAKIIYDVHEDYYLNLRFGGYIPGFVAAPLAYLVKWHGQFWGSFADGWINAETCYTLKPWFGNVHSIVVANKFNGQLKETSEPNPPRLLFTGTIAANWGIWESLELWKSLNENQELHLTVAGHTHDLALLGEVAEFVENSGLTDRFHLVGGEVYVPHDRIITEIARCTLGLGFYQLKENIKDRIPTKFYEFMALQKPLLFTSNPVWNELNYKHDFGRGMQIENLEQMTLEVEELLQNMSGQFFQRSLPEEAWSWQKEGEKLVGFIRKIIGDK